MGLLFKAQCQKNDSAVALRNLITPLGPTQEFSLPSLYSELPAILPSLVRKHVQMTTSLFTEVKTDGSTHPSDVHK